MDIDSIHLLPYWHRLVLDASEAVLANAVGDQGRVSYVSMRPDIGASLDDPRSLWCFYREVARSQEIALVEAHKVLVANFASVWLILKVPQSPTGFSYVGSLTIPFEDRSFVVVIQCQELGTTGVRESLIQILNSTFRLDGIATTIEPWPSDPYGPAPEGGFSRSTFDDPQYDRHFPEHPLSRLRTHLLELCTHTKFGSQVGSLSPFVYKGSSSR